MRSMRWMVSGVSLIGVMASSHPLTAQPAWSYALQWEHDGSLVTHFRLCIDGTCDVVAAERTAGVTWRASLPLLPAGDHRLVVEACNGVTCTAGRPDIFVRVQSVAVGPPLAPIPPPPVKSKGPRLNDRGGYPDSPR